MTVLQHEPTGFRCRLWAITSINGDNFIAQFDPRQFIQQERNGCAEHTRSPSDAEGRAIFIFAISVKRINFIKIDVSAGSVGREKPLLGIPLCFREILAEIHQRVEI